MLGNSHLDFEESREIDEDAGRDDPDDVEAELPVPGVPVRVADPQKPLGRDGHAGVSGTWRHKKRKVRVRIQI